MEPFCIWGEGFDLEQCDRIKQHGEMSEFMKARVGGRGPDDIGQQDEAIRKTDITWIDHREDTAWIFNRINEIGAIVNYDKFHLDLKFFDGFQYSKYGVAGHYDWHIDTFENPREGNFRKLSFSLMLSDPNEYEGGELLLCPNGDNNKPITLKPKKGELVAFYSHVPHKVAPVTSGERITLVTWALGPKIK